MAEADPDPSVRAAAVQGLDTATMDSRQHSKRLLPTLVAALKDMDRDVRMAAVRALRTVGEQRDLKEVALRELRKALEDEEPRVQYVATVAVDWVEGVPRQIERAVRSCLPDGVAVVRWIYNPDAQECTVILDGALKPDHDATIKACFKARSPRQAWSLKVNCIG